MDDQNQQAPAASAEDQKTDDQQTAPAASSAPVQEGTEPEKAASDEQPAS